MKPSYPGKNKTAPRAAYDKLIEILFYFRPVEEIDEIVHPDFLGYGTAAHEFCKDREALRNLAIMQAEQLRGTQFTLTRKSVIEKYLTRDAVFLILEDFELYMQDNDHTLPLRLSTTLEKVSGRWVITHFHGSTPDSDIAEEEAFPMEGLRKKNEELEEKIRERTRELEIEASLERIRARAMAMHSSEELHDVLCILFQQFDVLGIQPISAFLSLFSSEERVLTYRATGTSGARTQGSQTVEIDSLEVWKELYDKWKTDTSEDVEVIFYPKEVFPTLFGLFEETFASMPPDERMTPDHFPEGGYTMHGHTRFGYIGYNHTRLPTEEEKEILTKFAREFERVYQRFLDIEKAEAQARQSQIEAALERVRTRTMAMHNTDDIAATVTTFFKEIMGLGLGDSTRSGIGILSQSERMELWTASVKDKSEVVLQAGFLDMTIHPLLQGVKKAWQEGEPHFTYELRGEDKLAYFRAINKAPEYPIEIDLKKLPETVYHYSFLFRDGNLFVFANEFLRDDIQEIFKRFAAVFGQTYTRYLDLHKAEEQAREAQIEAAIEKVRSQSLAMHNTGEMQQVANAVYKQLKALGLEMDAVGMSGVIEEQKDYDVWIGGAPMGKALRIPYNRDTKVQRDYNKAIKERPDLFARTYKGKVKEEYINHLLTHGDFPKDLKNRMLKSDAFSTSISFAKNSSIQIARYTSVPYTAKENGLLKRFARVFEQAYIRFMDLQKAETQARESKIEMTLERIRSRAMAMHHTDELTDVLGVLFEQFDFLGINPVLTHLTLFDEENETFTLRIARGGKKQVIAEQLIDVNAVESWKTSFANWKKSELHAVDCIDYSPEMLPAVWEVLHEVMNALPEGQKIYPSDFPDGLYTTQGHCKYGYIGFNHSRRATDEEKDIVIRFAKEFGRLYQRFLDIQKAEIQAREALKQATLDRVRGQIASMRSTEDLERITPLVWNELKALGIPFIRCGVFIIDETNRTVQAFLSAPDGQALGAMQIPFDADKDTSQTVAYWKKGKVYKTHWDKDQFLAFMQNMTDLGQVSDQKQYQGAAEPPESLYLHFVPFSQGMMYVGNVEPLKEEQIELVQSLADAFAIAYARYEDFRQLEKAKERVEKTLEELKATQNQLVQSEKMASLGELTAGIAHEIQNPLNFVNNFSEVSVELIEEMMEEIKKGDLEEAMAIVEDIRQNLDKINHHGKRADGIVKGMLQHSRSGSGEKEPTDLNTLADEYLRLAYHGLRAKDKSFNATLETHFDKSIGKVQVVPQDMGRVILNLITNAFHVVKEKSSLARTSAGERYEPIVAVSTKKTKEGVEISVKDNGNGIPEAIKEKIFQPFFTTKPTGQGTGLGLSMSYDIVTKGHGGELKVDTKLGEGTTFTITIPEKQAL